MTGPLWQQVPVCPSSGLVASVHMDAAATPSSAKAGVLQAVERRVLAATAVPGAGCESCQDTLVARAPVSGGNGSPGDYAPRRAGAEINASFRVAVTNEGI